ncbi:hypothetical protein [Marinagarivorans algicola]|uniref:hypothetical protein n=1 Tax=Marinagarivorans algicola TaxID=1513270 RepID=UPI00138F5E8E|nr:hypothetical protein [Marinagarivorans algicola]
MGTEEVLSGLLRPSMDATEALWALTCPENNPSASYQVSFSAWLNSYNTSFIKGSPPSLLTLFNYCLNGSAFMAWF